MKHTLALTFLTALVGPALADPAPRGPDFVASLPERGVDRSFAASSGTKPIEPVDIVAFSLDSAVLFPSELGQIDAAARWLSEHRHARIVLEGHTDISGPGVYNADLATRRADAVRLHLLEMGVASDRIVVVVYGAARASHKLNPNDRRVVMYATSLPPQQIVARSLDHERALTGVWTKHGTLFEEQPGKAKLRNPALLARADRTTHRRSTVPSVK